MSPETSRPRKIRVGEFELEPASGELTRLDAGGGRGTTERLPPQPAQLLSMLIEKKGRLLSRREIQRRLWPDVEVDFEQGLNFCVRQVRAALGDSASEPRYVETLPRRGYRLLAPVEALPEPPSVASPGMGEAAEPAELPPETLPGRPNRARRRHMLLGAAVGAVITIALLTFWATAIRSASAPPRIGVRPFVAPAGFAGGADTEAIGERILLSLTQLAGPRAEVLGPRSTSAYTAEPASLRRMVSELDLDYLINGKFLREEGGERLLVELIRGDDGAHVWVESFSDLSSTRHVADATVAGTVALLGLASPTPESNDPEAR